jgi:putative hydrolase of the HAD superfamily
MAPGHTLIMSDNQIKAVLFDLGDTLLNFGRAGVVGLFHQGAKLSYDYLSQLGHPAGSYFRYCLRNLAAIRYHCWLSNLKKRDFNSQDLLKKLNAKIGAGLSEQQWEQLSWLWYEPLSKVCRNEPNLAETMAKLKEKGLKLGILSNTFVAGCILEKHLERLGILDFFEVRLYSCDFDFRKPDVRIFEIAAERIGQMPRNIAYVGDRIDKDIEPALKLGMHAVLKTAYTNAGKNVPEGARRIDQVRELPKLIDKINTECAKNQPQTSRIGRD